MSEYATNGAMLVCTCGTAPIPLQVTSNTLSSVQGQCIATVSDKVPMTNIKPFGPCKMKPTISGYAPCVPAPTAWTGFVASVQMPGGNPLLNTSTIPCGCGGMIQFQDSGQKKSSKVLINPSSPQITALEKAAINGTPFCEECEKRKREQKPVITRIYWVDEENNIFGLGDLPPGKEVVLCIDVDGVDEGETVEVVIKSEQGRRFKNFGEEMNFSPTVEQDGTAYIDRFIVEYE